MARKLFYFVRHGESILNAEHRRQGSEGGLSPLGKEQAMMTGERLSRTHFDVMLVSPYERTKETAAIIAGQIRFEKPVEYLELLIERRNPSEIVGQPADDPKVRYIVDLIDRSFHDDGFRYSDEENFTDLKARAKQLLDYLETREEKKFLIVTHSIFLKMVAAYMIHGDTLDSKEYNLLSYTNNSNNASITVAEYKTSILGDNWLGNIFLPKENRWRLIAWDDYTR
ncbi:MAG: histidine phosphatase family protein [Candidatus Paceibacterota bacterium]|jgi:probable phosphoglycerate mutase